MNILLKMYHVVHRLINMYLFAANKKSMTKLSKNFHVWGEPACEARLNIVNVARPGRII